MFLRIVLKENFDFVLVDSVYNLGREENLKLLTEKFKCAVIASINLTNPLKYGLNKHDILEYLI
jgi:hypothetical protein